MILKKHGFGPGEKGFWSAFVFLFLVTLALLGMGAYALLKSEGQNVANQTGVIQSNNSLDAGAFFSLNAIRRGVFTSTMESTSLGIGGSAVTLDTSMIGQDLQLLVTATEGAVERQLRLTMTLQTFNKNAIVTTGTVTNVTALDSNRVVDTERLVQQADSIPTVKLDSLKAMAVAQGHKIVGDWTAIHLYPMASFYQADGVTPNVTWITGNLTMNGADDLYGIFVVDGKVTINGTGRIYGVLYLPNVTSTVIRGGGAPSGSSIEGAIISHGNITGKGSHVTVEHNPTYMNEFCEFLKFGMPPPKTKIISWMYI